MTGGLLLTGDGQQRAAVDAEFRWLVDCARLAVLNQRLPAWGSGSSGDHDAPSAPPAGFGQTSIRSVEPPRG